MDSPSGTCQVCFRAQKTRGRFLVLHGYKRPGHGYIEGRCSGVDYAPFEVSHERTKWFVESVIKPHLSRLREHLARLQTRPTLHYLGQDHMHRAYTVELTPGMAGNYMLAQSHPSYESYLSYKVNDTERDIDHTGRDLAEYERRVAQWAPVAWPVEKLAGPVVHKTTVRRPSMESFDVSASCKCGWRQVCQGRGARSEALKAAGEHIRSVA